MKHLSILTLILSMTVFSCRDLNQPSANSVYPESYWRHLAYLMNLKDEVAAENWEAFAEQELFQPAVFYTHDGTFVLNPNEHILTIADHQEEQSFGNVKVIRLSEEYTDTTNFQFSTSYDGSDSAALHYQNNVLYFQSFDLTNQLIGVEDLQDWSIMVIHEMFHGYQRSVSEFMEYTSSVDIPGGPDKFLGTYHNELDWFKASVYEENEILKSIWIEGADLVSGLQRYESLRSARIDQINQQYGINIREVEDYEIFVEGQARYFESLCKRYLSQHASDTTMLTSEDLSSITEMFDGYDVKRDKALYDLYNDRYYYQLGYNLSMILEKYLPEFRQTVYTSDLNFNRFIDVLLSGQEE